MVAANVQITQGSGTRMATSSYTEGAVTVHDEKVILGENYLASYTIPSNGFPSTATANSHLLQIMAGASLKVRIRRIEIHQVAMATTVAMMNLQIVRLTSAGTGGSATGTAVLDPADGGAGATAITLVGAKGGENAQPIWQGAMYMMQTLAVSSLEVNPGIVIDFDRPRSKPLIIAAGTANGIAIKNITAIAGATVGINVWIDETSF